MNFLVLLLSAILFFSCASYERRKPLPRGARHAPVQKHEVGPERDASNSLVEKGKSELGKSRYERAFDFFQEAVNIDPTNGIGFYYLAYVKYKTGEYDQIQNFLEKAEALLGSSKEWKEKIDFLKSEIGLQR